MTDLVQKFRKILEDYHKPMTWENAPVIGKEKADFQKYAPQWLSEAADEIERLQIMESERNELLKFTERFDEHPENYDGPCSCLDCRMAAI